MTLQRRASDRAPWATPVGVFLVVASVLLFVLLAVLNRLTPLTVGADLFFGVLGGVLIQGESVLRLARLWRRNGNGGPVT